MSSDEEVAPAPRGAYATRTDLAVAGCLPPPRQPLQPRTLAAANTLGAPLAVPPLPLCAALPDEDPERRCRAVPRKTQAQPPRTAPLQPGTDAAAIDAEIDAQREASLRALPPPPPR